MRSIHHASKMNSVGIHVKILFQASARRSSGISTTMTGSATLKMAATVASDLAPPSNPIHDKKPNHPTCRAGIEFAQGHHSSGRDGQSTISDDPLGEQAADPGVRQANDLLSPHGSDACRGSGNSFDFDTPGSSEL